ncbi:hypothetical protein RRG08_017299 [Elysia crispata]|uniref:Uncharacterized protein n=1 Tax=Elysia crispata TaxID=231223 RepID=A0AAE0Y9D5_9GAST|nr:hypothetical protein RRG08_017299 [Elysia crispata]
MYSLVTAFNNSNNRARARLGQQQQQPTAICMYVASQPALLSSNNFLPFNSTNQQPAASPASQPASSQHAAASQLVCGQPLASQPARGQPRPASQPASMMLCIGTGSRICYKSWSEAVNISWTDLPLCRTEVLWTYRKFEPTIENHSIAFINHLAQRVRAKARRDAKKVRWENEPHTRTMIAEKEKENQQAR